MRVVIELHELQDPGRGGPRARPRLRSAGGCARCSGSHTAASSTPRPTGSCSSRITARWTSAWPWCRTVPTTSTATSRNRRTRPSRPPISAVRTAPKDGVVNLLFFGLIRPYKGLEDLLHVFNALPREEAERLWLTVVGETWEGCTEPAQPYRRQPARRPDHLRQRVRAGRGGRRGLRARRRGRAPLPPLVEQRHPARRDELGPAHRGDERRRSARGGQPATPARCSCRRRTRPC